MSEFAAQALAVLLANGVVATAIAFGAWIASRCNRPRLVHALCLLALVKLVTPPLWAVPVVTLAADAPLDPAAFLAADALDVVAMSPAPAATASFPAPATLALLAALLGTVTLLGLAWRRAHRFRRLLRVADPPSQGLKARTAAIATRVGLRRCPELLLLPARVSPMLCLLGGRTLLILPRDLLARVGEQELDALLAHELAHAERRDHWVRVLELVAFSIYWWLPTIWWLRRALHVAEERCCDARVVALHPDRPRAYADALLHTLDFLAGSTRAMPPAACGASTYTDLSRRLTTIMTMNPERPFSRLTRTCLAALAVGVLPVAPSFAQENERTDDGKVRAELRSAAKEVARLRAEIEAIRKELGAAAASRRDKVEVVELEDITDEKKAAKAKGRVVELEDVTDEVDRAVEAKKLAVKKKDLARAVEDATKNIEIDTQALHKALLEHTKVLDPEKLHAHLLEAAKLDKETLLRLTKDGADVHVLHDGLVAKIAEAHGSELKKRLGDLAKIEAGHEKAAAKADVEKAQAAAREAHRHAAEAHREAAEVQREAEAAHREAVIEHLRHVEKNRNEERAATRTRSTSDRREAEIRAIEAQMKKLAEKLEELRRQGGNEHEERGEGGRGR